ncbi:MAG: GIY-YIG nuclease family protein [Promethearchaeota archaeon]|nr:MAG: GIY-YIG nuclease family protein [Candidatus Lokiarchaeota archaeon]
MEKDKDEERPYGYIYKATNVINGMVYIGQTTSDRWKENQNPIEERWKEELGEAFRKLNRGEDLRYVENAIAKYGPEKFKIVEMDRAYSQAELDENETAWIRIYDSMNPEKGYNLKEGGLGGRLSDRAREKLSNLITDKYQSDSEYYDKQAKERKERAEDPEWIEKMAEINRKRAEDPEWIEKMAEINRKRAEDPEWIEKMTEINRKRAEDPEWIEKMEEINQEIARNPETREKMSNSLSEKWEDPKYQDSVRTGLTNKWQDPKYVEKQLRSRTDGKREIPDKMKFLREITEVGKKELIKNYDMDGKTINDRIREMLVHQGVHNYSEAKKYLENKDLKDVMKDIQEKLSNQPERPPIKKEITDRKQFLQDLQVMKNKDLCQKYEIGENTAKRNIQQMLGHHGVHNYTEAKRYLDKKNLKDVVKDITEKLSNPSERYQRTKEIIDKKQLLQDIQNLKKSEIIYKYDMDDKTINRKIETVFGELGVKNYSEAKKYIKDKNIGDIINEINTGGKEKKNEMKKPDDIKEAAQTEKNLKKQTQRKSH